MILLQQSFQKGVFILSGVLYQMEKNSQSRNSRLRRAITCLLAVLFVTILLCWSVFLKIPGRGGFIKTSRPLKVYKQLGITCKPEDCDNEHILRNMTQLSAAELEKSIPIIDITEHLSVLAKTLRRGNVHFLICQADSRRSESYPT